MKNKKRIAFILALCLIVSVLSVSALASNGTKTATLNFRDIKITINGSSITPKDANGNTVEPFIIDGTTYLPVRAVAEALGLSVEWDGETSTAKLTGGSNKAPSVKVGEGMYIVGKDIEAGTYLLTCTSSFSAYWARCKDASGELESIIANDNFTTTAYVTVKDGEYVTFTRCTAEKQ